MLSHRPSSPLHANALTVSIAACLLAIPLATELHAGTVALDPGRITHIEFRRIAPNRVEIDDGVITIRVDGSSSFLLYPFESPVDVSSLSFEWFSEGTVDKRDAAQEATKDGDDMRLRVGLVLEGEQTLWSPFAPRWAKTVRELLKYPSERMLYLVPGAMHAPGESWKSPYSDNVDMISVASTPLQDGWQRSEHRTDRPYRVVGLWLMADGDNTSSRFTSRLRNLELR